MSPPAAQPLQRNASIDLLRGVVMVVMALDHARDFFGQTPFDPTDLDRTTPAYFLTRWVTHFCAPSFVFLAGTAAWLSRAKKSDSELAGFLVKRGLWLILLELTVITFCWSFHFSSPILQVIWAIGCSMLFLAALVRLRASAATIAAIGGVIVLGHNELDHVHVPGATPLHAIWSVLHETEFGQAIHGFRYGVFYPLIPWIGVMALGYAFGSLFTEQKGAARPPRERSRLLVRIGLAVTLGFVVVRASNLYGDPDPWAPRGSIVGTLMSFLDCQKYPPSLCYLLMTLGPAILLLGVFDRRLEGTTPSWIARVFIVYGRVPLFYYVLHLMLLHAASDAVYSAETGHLTLRTEWYKSQALDIGLPLTYVTWILAVALLYPLCRWFAQLKASPWGRQRAWLSYL